VPCATNWAPISRPSTAKKPTELADLSQVDACRDGDVVMVKSSLGIGFGRIVKALLDNYPALSDSSTQD
jgi:UDP-N-acetylmuramoyl-tripeptide--D-alanyl-D-alanine ligase